MKLVYLSGGVGGARLLTGLDHVMAQGALTVVVNTGDDFKHWGLRICPDLDTVMYNLAGLAHAERGWGLQHETHNAFELMRRYGAPDWFQLSDIDLATHIRRTELLNEGQSLAEATATLCLALGITRPVLPMTDAEVQTHITTADNRCLAFQTWFVQERCKPIPSGVEQKGTFEDSPQVIAAIEAADAVLIGPSNPYVSIDPMLYGMGTLVALQSKPRFAVSPIVGGKAVKGPLAEMISALAGQEASAQAVAAHYDARFGAPLSGMVVEHGDAFPSASFPVRETTTVMHDAEARAALAQTCIDFVEEELRR